MRKWNLREHGDGAERKWGPKIGSNFPSYEVFWREHIVPLTCRALNASNIRLRPSVPRHFSDVASSHYAVFKHLARSYNILATSGLSDSGSLVYEFYSHLCSVQDMINRFHGATKRILAKYDRGCVPDLERRLARFGDHTLASDYDDTFDIIAKYRNHAMHDHGAIMVDGKLPKADRLEDYDDLAVLSRLLAAQNRDEILNEDFVDADIQGATDLARLENLLDRIWDVILCEFEEMEHLKKYRTDQAIVTDEDIAFCKSRSLLVSSASASFSGSEPLASGTASVWPEES